MFPHPAGDTSPEADNDTSPASEASEPREPSEPRESSESSESSDYDKFPDEGCPPDGVHHYHHDTDCEKYYLCVNGTGSLQTCPNGLLYQEHGAVYEFCAYHWNVHCPEGKTAPGPVSSPGCPWQFGIFPEESNSHCSTHYSECTWGEAHRKPCHPEGLVYDDRIHGCNWPDQVGCKGEDILGVRCPEEDKYNPFYPYPRYYHNDKAIITCVDHSPRLINCPDGHYADKASLTCLAHDESESRSTSS